MNNRCFDAQGWESIYCLEMLILKVPLVYFSALRYRVRGSHREATSVNASRATSIPSMTAPGSLMVRPWRKNGGKSN